MTCPERVIIGPAGKPAPPLALGGSWYVPDTKSGSHDAELTDAIAAAYDRGIRHFDTASGYGDGHSERTYGRFLAGRRDEVFLASKSDPADASAEAMTDAIDQSLRRLGTDYVDLYYIHWPKTGIDMRPRMEALERARTQGKVGAVGVSNFSVEQMRQVQDVGTIDAHQLGYNLLWRYPEEALLPFCQQHGIAVVAYSTLAHGILTGKFPRTLELDPRDQRNRILPFRDDVWPQVHAGVEELKSLAGDLGRPLMQLAIRWTLAQPGITAVIAGARNRAQVEANCQALDGDIPDAVFARMTAISDGIVRHIPDEGNVFNHHP